MSSFDEITPRKSDELSPRSFPEINYAIVIAIVISVILALGIIVLEIQAERYSSIYIQPDSYSNYQQGGPVTFVYGIHSYEKKSMDYTIVIRAGSSVIGTKSVTLKPGEIYEERKNIDLPKGTAFPVKISVEVASPRETNEVHFWVRDSQTSG